MLSFLTCEICKTPGTCAGDGTCYGTTEELPVLDVAAYEAAHQDLEQTMEILGTVDINPIEVLRCMAVDLAKRQGLEVDHASFDAGAAHLESLGIGPLEPDLNEQDGRCND